MTNQSMDKFIQDIVVKAGKETLKYFGKAKVQYTKKHDEDFVTQADLASNDLIVKAIKKNYPSHGIISEETKDYRTDAEYVWIIDPLDGTTNFKKAIPIFGVIIALMKNKEVIMGAIYIPFLQDLYFAAKGKGAFKNGKRIFCSKKIDMNNSRGTGDITISGKLKIQIRKFSEASEKYNYWITEFGAGAYDSMLVAEGKAEWFFCPANGGGLWDVAASYIIMKESGCVITGFDDKPWTIKHGIELIAANPQIHKEIMNIIGNKSKR